MIINQSFHRSNILFNIEQFPSAIIIFDLLSGVLLFVCFIVFISFESVAGKMSMLNNIFYTSIALFLPSLLLAAVEVLTGKK